MKLCEKGTEKCKRANQCTYSVVGRPDEKPKQFLGEKRKPISMKLGIPGKYDYEYVERHSKHIYAGRIQSQKAGDAGHQKKNHAGFCALRKDAL